MLDILLVDDEPTIRLAVGDALRAAGYKVTVMSDGEQALTAASAHTFDVVITDIRLPKLDGISLFRRLRADSPSTDVILITAFGAVADAVSALKQGAHDYLTKPFDPDELVVKLTRIAERRSLRSELDRAQAEISASGMNRAIVGHSPPMVRLLDRLKTIAHSEAPVLITGESGTGKELVARSLHEQSSRRPHPFVAVNCAAFPETLLEAELFGHERGAFTGAVKRREGRFKAADAGTLFLDEIAEIPLPAQAKLLRVLQEGNVEPLGTNLAVKVDVRLISATHRNLKERIADGRFREDLYYRLNVLDIHIPALRERRADLPLLAEHFLRKFTPAEMKSPTISPAAWAALSAHAFPGNVRELEHALQHAVVLAQGGEIMPEHLPRDLVASGREESSTPESFREMHVAAKEFEREYLLRALTVARGKRARAAEMLGISRKNLWEKLKAHGLSNADIETEAL